MQMAFFLLTASGFVPITEKQTTLFVYIASKATFDTWKMGLGGSTKEAIPLSVRIKSFMSLTRTVSVFSVSPLSTLTALRLHLDFTMFHTVMTPGLVFWHTAYLGKDGNEQPWY